MHISKLENYKSFIKDCRFFYCKSLYDGDWDGTEKYIVASDISEDELRQKYPVIMDALSPLIWCNAACGEVYADSLKEIDKYDKRMKRNTVTLHVNQETEEIFREQASESPAAIIEEIESRKETICKVREAFKQLTELQQRRAKLHYIDRLSIAEIANLENVSKKAVHYSLISVEQIFKKVFKTYYTKSTPLSLHSRGVNKNEGDDSNE